MSRWHGMLLDGKRVDDDPLSLYGDFLELVPEYLHARFAELWGQFTEELAGCDISKDEQALENVFGLVSAKRLLQHHNPGKANEFWMITVRREQLHLRTGTRHVQYFSFAINEHPYDFMRTMNHTTPDGSMRTNGVLLNAIPINEGCYNEYKDDEFSCN